MLDTAPENQQVSMLGRAPEESGKHNLNK
jgi:hypothetical protein